MREKKIIAVVTFCMVVNFSVAQTTTVVIDGSNPTNTISRHIYGHFSEHLGRCIYDGFWVGDSVKVPKKTGYV